MDFFDIFVSSAYFSVTVYLCCGIPMMLDVIYLDDDLEGHHVWSSQKVLDVTLNGSRIQDRCSSGNRMQWPLYVLSSCEVRH